MLRDRKGMALVLTLMAVSFMVAVTVQLGSSVSWQMQAAANQGALAQLDAMLLSGLRLAQAALLTDQRDNKHDSAFDRWGIFKAENLSALFPDGKLKIQVTDLSGLLQINALALTAEDKKEQQNKKNKDGQKLDKEKKQRELWQRFLSKAAGINDEAEVNTLLDSLADWIDEDDEERDNGAERTHYNGQSPPYAPADRPIFLTEELFLIKGWEELLRGGEQEEAERKRVVFNALTAVGREGKININTAPAVVLLALHEDMTEELAAKLIEFRQEEENKDKLEQPDWPSQVPGHPGDIVFDQELVTVSSSWFKVTVQAEFRGLRRSGAGLIHRMDNQEQELLWWKAE
ncbi:type II secretion system minor pseudopilin GspK [Candidatus Electronema sp. TJ]|uniref:type II secretion system minor pseudopilin GspK n=1 Tax=Candidatus Electronema sp. TJ TaxID=3401573 RepID=UPI003AA98101